jgi:hypothetical protein
MFHLDAHTHTQMAQDRIDSLNRSRRIEAKPSGRGVADPADRQQRGGVNPAPSHLPQASCTTAALLRSSRA